jgi:hypothetical protein
VNEAGQDVALSPSTVVAVLTGVLSIIIGAGAFAPEPNDASGRAQFPWQVASIALATLSVGIIAWRIVRRVTVRQAPDVLATIFASPHIYQVGPMHLGLACHQNGAWLTFVVGVQNNRDGEGRFGLSLEPQQLTWIEAPPTSLNLTLPPAAVVQATWTSRILPITQDFEVHYRVYAGSDVPNGRLIRTVRRRTLREGSGEIMHFLSLLKGHFWERAKGPTELIASLALSAHERPKSEFDSVPHTPVWIANVIWPPGSSALSHDSSRTETR